MKKPWIISFSGIDGSGKTTQINLMEDYLKAAGYRVKTTKVQFAALEVIYEYCQRHFGDSCAYDRMPPFVVRMGLAYDVAHHYLQLEKELAGYNFLLCDRHKIDFIAYGIAYGCNPQEMEWVEKILSLVNEPDIIIHFKTDLKTSQARIQKRTQKLPRSDEELAILSKVKQSFKNLLGQKENVIEVDGDKNPTETSAFILEALKDKNFI